MGGEEVRRRPQAEQDDDRGRGQQEEQLDDDAAAVAVAVSPMLPRKPITRERQRDRPATSSITRLRPVSAHTEPQIITTVQARASRPKTIRAPPTAPPTAPEAGDLVVRTAPPQPVTTAPPMNSTMVTSTPSAPKMKPEDGGGDHVRRARRHRGAVGRAVLARRRVLLARTRRSCPYCGRPYCGCAVLLLPVLGLPTVLAAVP